MPFFYSVITRVTGLQYEPLWDQKIPFIVRALVGATLFCIFFFFAYRKLVQKDSDLIKIGCWSIGLLLLVFGIKYALYHFAKGYVPDRLIMYALPSPRLAYYLWLIALVLGVSGYLYFREKIENLPKNQFLIVSMLTFTIFALGVAGLRDGVGSIIDSLTRTFWEYTGSLPLVEKLGVSGFLGDFVINIPSLPVHTTTHPPGYVLVLYFATFLVGKSLLGMAIILVVLGALTIVPLYSLWSDIFSEGKAKRLIQLFTFTPSLVIFTATSLEAFYILAVWTTLTLVFFGWRRSYLISAIAGATGAYALFSNFLFLLLAPFFLAVVVYLYRTNESPTKVVKRFMVTLLVGISSLVLMRLTTGYSILNNFWAAHAINKTIVESNFESAGIYVIYLVMNIVAFFLYLGVPTLLFYKKDRFTNHISSNPLFLSGLGLILFFLVIGIFQGEIERIWLFMVPFFIVSYAPFVNKFSAKTFTALLALLSFQIILTQLLFFTYW